MSETVVVQWSLAALGALIVAVAWLIVDKINGLGAEIHRTRERLHKLENDVASLVTLDRAKKALGRE